MYQSEYAFSYETNEHCNFFLLVFDIVYLLGKNATDDLRLSALDLKPNFKLMMVGSLEVDIQDVQNSINNRDVIDDFDDDNDERTTYNFHKMEVSVILFSLNTFDLVAVTEGIPLFRPRALRLEKSIIFSTMNPEDIRNANSFSIFKALFQIIIYSIFIIFMFTIQFVLNLMIWKCKILLLAR